LENRCVVRRTTRADPCAVGGEAASFIFFEIVPEIKPLIVCGCHLVTLAISPDVAPSLRRSSSITALFDPSRASGFRPFAAGLACFGAVLAAAGFSPRLALGATFFWQ
jgi:hypothetical protein